MEGDTVDVRTFIRNLEREFDDLDPGTLNTTTRLLDLPQWTSLQALIVLVSLEHDYGISMSADEFRGAETIEDLYGLVVEKLSR
jgi:acyl carrier protein